MQIFTFWDKGEENLATINAINVKGWRKLGYTVTVLSNDTYDKYIDIYRLPKKFDNLIVQHKSDCIRCLLLLKYAPCIWLDSSILLTENLDWWLPGPDKSISLFHWKTTELYYENWAIYNKIPNNPVLEQWYNLMVEVHDCSTQRGVDVCAMKSVRQEIINGFFMISPILVATLAYIGCINAVTYLRMHAAVKYLIETDPVFANLFYKEVHLEYAENTALRWLFEEDIQNIDVKTVRINKLVGNVNKYASCIIDDKKPQTFVYIAKNALSSKPGFDDFVRKLYKDKLLIK